MRCLIIHNPDAGDGEPVVKDVKRVLKDSHYRTTTVAHKDSERLEDELANEPDIVAIIGGDGTMKTLLDYLPRFQMPILILPSGTANNIATSLGILDSPIEIASALPRIETRRLDVGAVVGPFGARNFLESAGFGFFATTMDLGIKGETATERLMKARQSVATAAATHEPKQASIIVDGSEVAAGEFLFVEVSSIGFVGPSLELVSEAQSDDGLLDVITLVPSRRGEMVDWLLEQDGPPPVETYRGRSITIESSDRFRIDDKEVTPLPTTTTIDVTTGRAGLRILIPTGASD